MATIGEIFNELKVHYSGVYLTEIPMIKQYGQFLCEQLDKGEKHIVATSLHTGSPYYVAVAFVVSSLFCLFYRNTDIEELIQTLSEGDMLIFDGQRAKYKGIISSEAINSGVVKYFVVEDNATRYTPLDKIHTHNITKYYGSSTSVGRKGVRGSFSKRKEFLQTYFNDSNKANISTEVQNSIAFIIDKSLAEDLYRGVKIIYRGKSVFLSDLVTASYYSENECYQIGNNPTKEEPVLKFYSKISVCREDILNDKLKRICGCVLDESSSWFNDSEACNIIDRKSLKFNFALAKTNYANYIEWLKKDDYAWFAYTPESVRQQMPGDFSLLFNARKFGIECDAFLNHHIEDKIIASNVTPETIMRVKNALLKVKYNAVESVLKNDFLISAYFLLNICKSSIVPLKYYDRAYKNRSLDWNFDSKFSALNEYCETVSTRLKDDVKFAIIQIKALVSGLYESNTKGDEILKAIKDKKVQCMVLTKAYYENLFNLWLTDLGVDRSIRPQTETLSSFYKRNASYYNVIFTVPGDYAYNPYANFSYVKGIVLAYDYESYKLKALKSIADNGRRLIREKNYFSYDIDDDVETNAEINDKSLDSAEEDKFDFEMNSLIKDLEIQTAYRYVSNNNFNNDGVVNISKIMIFESGNVGYFTKNYKAYRISGAGIDEVDLDDLKIGDSLIFTKENENKDIVDLLLNQFLDSNHNNTAYREFYELSKLWKTELKKYMRINNLTYQDLSNSLSIYGCKKHQVTIRSWLTDELYIVGPRDEEDYVAIVKLLKLAENAEAIKEACDIIRSLRTKILGKLAKLIINKYVGDKTSSTENELDKIMAEKAESLSQVEQIVNINTPESVFNIPAYLANKPCVM